jgi:hypothetical protein
MVVDIKTELTFSAGRPRELFRYSHLGAVPLRGYDVSPDGRRFLMVQLVGRPGREPVTKIHIVLNWFEELKRLIPTN